MRLIYTFLIFSIIACKNKQATTEVANTAPSTPISKTEVPTNEAANSNITETAGLQWIDMQAAANHKNEEGKMYFVDVYTDWCGWCKVMDKKTFSDPKVQKALKDRFHVVKFNAEQQESINFNNKKYDFQQEGRNGINMLAVELLGGEMGFPSYVYLDKNKKPFKVSKGFMPSDQFLQELATIR